MKYTAKRKVPLVHMQQSAAERKADYPAPTASTKGKQAPSYPYGLSVSLDHHGLKKLGIKGAPKPGSTMMLNAKAHVTSSSSSNDGNGVRHSAQLQITHLGIGDDTPAQATPDDSGKVSTTEKIGDKQPVRVSVKRGGK